jgi:hypothetical protein
VKLVLKIALGIILAVVILIVGCTALIASSGDDNGGLGALGEQDGVVRVQAPEGRCWSGAIGSSTKDGCGNAEFPIEGEAIIVANAQKQTEGDWPLVLILEVAGEEVDRAETTAEFGIAQVSEG